ncbi:hypothetical protein P9057_07615 [Gallibacterium anatis]|uniref:hypothetical protein n=1 Tax=Gallibacterium anatis TaxID=750 RepID=UPI003004EB53
MMNNIERDLNKLAIETLNLRHKNIIITDGNVFVWIQGNIGECFISLDRETRDIKLRYRDIVDEPNGGYHYGDFEIEKNIVKGTQTYRRLYKLLVEIEKNEGV